MILSKAVHIPQYVSRRSKVLKMKIILFLLAVFLSLNELPVLGLNCNPKSLIEHWEGRMPCVYLDTVGIKTIGVGYNMKNADARAAFKAIGADYDKFYNGPVTPSTKKCDCSAVPCLTEEQIDELFDRSVKIAIADAQKVISTFSTLCCPVQDVMVDMAFTLGGKGFSQFTTFAKLVTSEYWKAAGDDLTVSKWCVHDAPRRCLSDSATVAKGCGCSGLYTQACDVQASSCCSSVKTCCKGTLTFKSKYATKTFEELLCCPFPKASCCTHNKCCPSDKPICGCPDPTGVPEYCCPAAFPICRAGKCYRADGAMSKGEPALTHQ